MYIQLPKASTANIYQSLAWYTWGKNTWKHVKTPPSRWILITLFIDTLYLLCIILTREYKLCLTTPRPCLLKYDIFLTLTNSVTSKSPPCYMWGFIQFNISRTYAKALVKIIISHEKFDSYWVAAIKDENKMNYQLFII